MNELGLGQINPPPHDRDAVHVAVIQAVCADTLWPGAHVFLNHEGKAKLCSPEMSVGIVDPFIVSGSPPSIATDARVWIWLKPGSIRTLRHHWTHPDIPESNTATSTPTVEQAVEELKTFAKELGVAYEDMLEHAGAFLDTGEEWVKHSFSGIGQPDDFWHNYYLVTGDERAKDGDKEVFNWFFTCGGCS